MRAIVIMGSGAHGGGLVRSLVDVNEHDLDWGIMYDGEIPSNEILTELRDEADKLMASKSAEIGFKHELESCYFFNPARPVGYKQILSEENIDKDYFKPFQPGSLLYHIQPTIPKEIGIQKFSLLIHKLHKLKNQDIDIFNEYIGRLTDAYMKMHELKDKHFNGFDRDNEKTATLVTKVLYKAEGVMGKEFKALLEKAVDELDKEQETLGA